MIKENSISPCRAGLEGILAKLSEVPSERAGSLPIWTHIFMSFLKKARYHLTGPAHLLCEQPLTGC